MTSFRNFLTGPWRAVPVLGVTQITAWGAIFYTPVLIVPLIAADRGWSMSFAMGGLSLAASLYDAAVASLGRIFGMGARRPITALTLAGGFASTVSWPVTHLLIESIGWRGCYLVYAAVLALINAPLHAFLLPRERVHAEAPETGPVQPPAKTVPAKGVTFVLVASAFATYAFVPSGLSAHLLAIFQRNGIDAATAVWIGALFGPAQVLARLIEFSFGRDLHPLWVARCACGALLVAFALLAVFGMSPIVAAVFALMFGGANGLVTIARGAVPLALFGASGDGRLMGRLATPFLIVQSAAALVLAFVVERYSDAAALTLAAGFATVAFICAILIRRPG